MDAATTSESIADVANNAIDKARSVSELAFLIVIVVVSILACVLVPMLLNAWQGRNERKEARELEREHKETIARSHDKTAEAICKLAENDSRSIECQQQIREQMVNLHIGQHATKGAVIEALTIAEERAPDERTRSDIGRIRKRLESHV
jgi:Tfp pilus assembly protein FimT